MVLFFISSSRHFCGGCAVVDIFLVVLFIVFFAGVLALTSGYFFIGATTIADRVLLLVRQFQRCSLLQFENSTGPREAEGFWPSWLCRG